MKSAYLLDRPAAQWESAIPVGNGRLGASVWGKTAQETITINEESMWCSKPRARSSKDAYRYLDTIRSLLLEGQVNKAQLLAQMAMTSTPKCLNPYQKACDFCLFMPHEHPTDYQRVLNMDDAVTTVSYTIGDTRYERTCFVSARYQVLVLHLTAHGSVPLQFHANLTRRPFEEESGGSGTNQIWLRGHCGDSIRYYAGALLDTNGAPVYQIGDYLAAENVFEATFYLDCETDFTGSDPQAVCLQRLQQAQRAGYETLYRDHIEDYRRLFSTMSLELEPTDLSRIPMDQLLERCAQAPVRRWLIQQLMSFGRYLMISSSYHCELPATLQGIWCGSYTPPWESKYTININLQMNYWMADPCGLSECFAPLVQLVEKLNRSGRQTAQNVYHCRGSAAHHNTDCWASSDIEGLPTNAAIWPMGEAWLSLNLYDHYEYTRDRDYLARRALPVMRDCVLFFYDYLYRCPDGSWISGPSASPENSYRTPSGQKAALTMGPAMDHQIIRELCTAYRKACSDLKLRDEVCEMAAQILAHLPPDRLTPDGRIREWSFDCEETEPGHRHISHLFALYPGSQIRPDTPQLFEAAKEVLRVRLENGGGHTGWSRAWLICMMARLRDPRQTAENIRLFLENSIRENLYDVHPPFQIDGNFGFCAGIVECLAQKTEDLLTLLPAAPDEWKTGVLRGLRLKGGVTLSMDWDEAGLRYCLAACEKQTITVRFADYPAAQWELMPGRTVCGRFGDKREEQLP